MNLVMRFIQILFLILNERSKNKTLGEGIDMSKEPKNCFNTFVVFASYMTRDICIVLGNSHKAKLLFRNGVIPRKFPISSFSGPKNQLLLPVARL